METEAPLNKLLQRSYSLKISLPVLCPYMGSLYPPEETGGTPGPLIKVQQAPIGLFVSRHTESGFLIGYVA